MEESVAAVDARRHEGKDESLRRLLGEHTADPADVVQVEIRAVADTVNLGRMFRFLSKTSTSLRSCSPYPILSEDLCIARCVAAA